LFQQKSNALSSLIIFMSKAANKPTRITMSEIGIMTANHSNPYKDSHQRDGSRLGLEWLAWWIVSMSFVGISSSSPLLAGLWQ
jgi:hypothetical protein